MNRRGFPSARVVLGGATALVVVALAGRFHAGAGTPGGDQPGLAPSHPAPPRRKRSARPWPRRPAPPGAERAGADLPAAPPKPHDAAEPVTEPAAPSLATAPTLGEPFPLPTPLPDRCTPIAVDVAPPARAPAGSSYLRVLGGKGVKPGELAYPRAIAAAADGTAYVVDKQGRIQKLDRDLRFVSVVHTPEDKVGRPTGLSIGKDGELIVADTHYARVLVYSKDLKVKTAFGRPGSKDGGFLYITDARQASDGRFFTADYGDDVARVQVFDAAGKLLARWGSFGAGEGEFQRPMALALDEKQGELVVADAVNHRLQVLDLATGKPLRAFGGLGDEAGRLKYPYDVSIDAEGRYWVTEFGNHRVQVFDRAGRSLGCWGKAGRGPGEVAYPWGCALLPDGRALVIDSGNDRLYEIARAAVVPSKREGP